MVMLPQDPLSQIGTLFQGGPAAPAERTIDDIIAELTGMPTQQAEAGPLGGGGIAATIAAVLGDAFSAGAGRRGQAMDRIQRQRNINVGRTQRSLDRGAAAKERGLRTELGQARHDQAMSREDDREAARIEREDALIQQRIDREDDENRRERLQDIADFGMLGDIPGYENMTLEEIEGRFSTLVKQRQEEQMGAAEAARVRAVRDTKDQAAGAILSDAMAQIGPDMSDEDMASLRSRLKKQLRLVYGTDEVGLVQAIRNMDMTVTATKIEEQKRRAPKLRFGPERRGRSTNPLSGATGVVGGAADVLGGGASDLLNMAEKQGGLPIIAPTVAGGVPQAALPFLMRALGVILPDDKDKQP